MTKTKLNTKKKKVLKNVNIREEKLTYKTLFFNYICVSSQQTKLILGVKWYFFGGFTK